MLVLLPPRRGRLWKSVEVCGQCGKFLIAVRRERKSLFQRRVCARRRSRKPLLTRNNEAKKLRISRVSTSYFRVADWLDSKHLLEESAMAAISPMRPKFVHRRNQDGTLDSICRECFITVATSRREVDLERSERTHACDPWTVDRFKKLAKPDPGPFELPWRASA